MARKTGIFQGIVFATVCKILYNSPKVYVIEAGCPWFPDLQEREGVQGWDGGDENGTAGVFFVCLLERMADKGQNQERLLLTISS